jgi:WD40 repeat protein
MPRLVILLALLVVGCGGAERAVSEPAAPEPAGTLVVLSDRNRLTTVDVASGRRATRRVRSLPACSADLFVTGGHVVFSAVVNGVTTVYSLPLSLDGRPTRLGTAHTFGPSPTDGRVWLAGTDCDRSEMVGVREVSVDGRVTGDSDRRVPGNWVSAAVPDGLVTSRNRRVHVWDPATGRTGEPLGLEMAWHAHGRLLSGCPTGSDCDELAVLDTATGKTVRARGPHRLDPFATFSPDGSLLAAPARDGRRWSVALVDVRTGSVTAVRGSSAGEWYPEVSWSAGGWLFIRAGFRVKAFRPGAARAVLLPTRLPRTTIGFAAG